MSGWRKIGIQSDVVFHTRNLTEVGHSDFHRVVRRAAEHVEKCMVRVRSRSFLRT